MPGAPTTGGPPVPLLSLGHVDWPTHARAHAGSSGSLEHSLLRTWGLPIPGSKEAKLLQAAVGNP